jgi:hypothetical protein
LADAQGKEVRVDKNDIEEKTITQLSPMPGDFATKLSEQELSDLMGFLLAQRRKE